MNPSSLLGIGTRALANNLAALQVTGNNIANVNTRGYSRQSVQIRNSSSQESEGSGNDQTTVVRAHNAYLARQVTLTTAIAGADQARADKLALIEPIFASGPNGIGASLNGMLNAFGDIASAPLDMSARQVVLARMDETAARFKDAAARLDIVAQGLNDEMRSAIDTVNSYGDQIAKLNTQISLLKGRGPDPNELLDRRDQLIDDLNAVVQTTMVEATDGSVSLFIGGSQPLVLGGNAMRLTTGPDRYDPAWISLNIQTSKGDVALDPSQITGGSLAGLWRFQRMDLIEARSQLGRLATAMAQEMNRTHALGLDMTGQPGKPLFHLPVQTIAMSANSNGGDTVVTVTPQDATQYAASDYEMRLEAGQWLVTRLSDGQTASFDAAQSTLQLDGLRLAITGSALAEGDRFLLRPFAMAAGAVQPLLRSPAALAVASPVAAAPAPSNRGDLAVTSVMATSAHGALQRTATLVANAGGGFDVNTFDAAGAPVSTSVAYVPGQPISLNGWTLTLHGTPAAGDTITVKANTSGLRDAAQVPGLLGLRDAPVFDGSSLSNGYATALSQLGARIQAARMSSDTSAAMARQAAQSESSVAGVNLDEEAAMLLQYQQAYQAAARMLQTADTVFKTLMNGVSQ